VSVSANWLGELLEEARAIATRGALPVLWLRHFEDHHLPNQVCGHDPTLQRGHIPVQVGARVGVEGEGAA
jgi:hypothetical protein